MNKKITVSISTDEIAEAVKAWYETNYPGKVKGDVSFKIKVEYRGYGMNEYACNTLDSASFDVEHEVE